MDKINPRIIENGTLDSCIGGNPGLTEMRQSALVTAGEWQNLNLNFSYLTALVQGKEESCHLMCAFHAGHFVFSTNPHSRGTTIPIFQMTELRLKEDRKFAPCPPIESGEMHDKCRLFLLYHALPFVNLSMFNVF